MLRTGQCYRRDIVTNGKMLPTGQCYKQDKGRKLRDKLTNIFSSQHEKVTNGEMLETGQFYRQFYRQDNDTNKIFCCQQEKVKMGQFFRQNKVTENIFNRTIL